MKITLELSREQIKHLRIAIEERQVSITGKFPSAPKAKTVWYQLENILVQVEGQE